MKKTCLVIIYNHQFTANIEKLEKLYGDRFDKIYHLMPFYTGDKENVIPVYENSYQFPAYITQGLEKFYSDEFDYYAFMGDDVMLHPRFSNNTIEEMLKVDSDTAYIARSLFVIADEHLLTKSWLFPTVLNYMYSDNKDTLDKLLPDIPSMLQKYKKLGMAGHLISEDKVKYLQDLMPVNSQHNFYYKYMQTNVDENMDYKKLLESYKEKSGESVRYLFPFAGGFSDFFVIPKNYIKKFAYYAGLLARERIFAEVAAPTCLCICFDKIMMPKTTDYKVVNYSAVDKRRKELPGKYNNSVKKLLDDWNDVNLLVHPVKYSMWEMDVEK